jgi:hypothetical protein
VSHKILKKYIEDLYFRNVRLKQRFRSCENKIRFNDDLEARKFATKVAKKVWDGKKQNIYYCVFCEGFHLTTNRKSKKHRLIEVKEVGVSD